LSFIHGFPTELVDIIKQDASTISNVEALVQPKTIFIDIATLNIEEGDIIERKLPNGNTEQYRVLDRGFHKGMLDIPDHYQIKVEKLSTLKYKSRPYTVNNYNIGEAGKININSVDNSMNVDLSLNDRALFETLLVLAQKVENSQEIMAKVNSMRDSVGKSSFLQKYNDFIQSAANHMTLFAPFIPALTQFLR
jgi:hypothetical protein